jgi:nucleoside-diphosphate-sugar epimerase
MILVTGATGQVGRRVAERLTLPHALLVRDPAKAPKTDKPPAPTTAPDFELKGWVTSYEAIAAGDLAEVTGDVEELTGHRPRPLRKEFER